MINPIYEERERDTKEVAISSIKYGLVLTILVYLLYNYQKYISTFNNRYQSQPFVYLFLMITVTMFSIELLTPKLANNVMYGIGFAVGASLLKQILRFN